MFVQEIKYYEFVELHTIPDPSRSQICFERISFLVYLAN